MKINIQAVLTSDEYVLRYVGVLLVGRTHLSVTPAEQGGLQRAEQLAEVRGLRAHLRWSVSLTGFYSAISLTL